MSIDPAFLPCSKHVHRRFRWRSDSRKGPQRPGRFDGRGRGDRRPKVSRAVSGPIAFALFRPHVIVPGDEPGGPARNPFKAPLRAIFFRPGAAFWLLGTMRSSRITASPWRSVGAACVSMWMSNPGRLVGPSIP